MRDDPGLTNDERVKRRLRALTTKTNWIVEVEMQEALGRDWLVTARRELANPRLRMRDSSGFLAIVIWAWERGMLQQLYPPAVHGLAIQVRGIRNRVGHDETFDDADTARMLATIAELETLLYSPVAEALAAAEVAAPGAAPIAPPAVPTAAIMARHSPASPPTGGGRRRRARPTPGPARYFGALLLFLCGGCAVTLCLGIAMLRLTSAAPLAPTAAAVGAARPTSTPLAGRATGTPERACFSQTGLCATGVFLDYWRATGGLRRHGAPLTREREETLEDGRLYTVQYFERSRLQHLTLGFTSVQPGALGRELHGLEPAVPATTSGRYLPATGHTIAGRFLEYWAANGGEAGLGLPLGEAHQERLEDGREYTVQWFERARLELHPGVAAPDEVQLGQLGRLALASIGRGSR
jgi:hypothetical protein